MFKVKCTESEPYGVSIETFLKQEFPVLLKPQDSAVLDLLTEAIVASGQVRYGPRPSPESLVSMRQVITRSIEKGSPIPFLVAWGSEKPNGSGIDIAELFGLKTIACLNKRVSAYYAPGIQVHIRIEDASAPYLFHEDMAKARRDAKLYTDGLVALNEVMGYDFIRMRPESNMVEESKFNATADAILPYMEQQIFNPEDPNARKYLTAQGWQKPLDAATITYFMERYAKLYPTKTAPERIYILARYFASALARYSLDIRGEDKAWEGQYLELAFIPPTPGVSAERMLRRISYRTMPSGISSQHMCPWRAKGYLRINGEVSAALTSFDSDLEFNRNTLELSSARTTVSVQADYVVL